jgi:hypothetical protein
MYEFKPEDWHTPPFRHGELLQASARKQAHNVAKAYLHNQH